MMTLRVQMLTPVSANCSWNRRMSSNVAASGDPLQKRSKPLTAADVAPLRSRAELARIHIFNHTLTQRGDSFGCHKQLLS
jgi:hypothetical protein